MSAHDEDDFCPELPPHLLKKESKVTEDDFCPELPPHLQASINNSSIDSLKSNVTTKEDVCPQLPPDMQVNDFGKDSCGQDLQQKTDDFCPELPPHLVTSNSADEFCPQLPPHLQKSIGHLSTDSTDAQPQIKNRNVIKSKTECFPSDCESQAKTHVQDRVQASSSADDSEADDESDQFCPALPPHLKKKSPRILGPAMPPENYKPSISHSEEDSEDDVGPVVGPLPSSKPVDMDRYIEETIANRTKSSADRIQAASDMTPTRESWMLELPEDKPLFAGLGLQARQFARKAKTDRGDTSIWTDTPVDKERKAQRAAERAAAGIKEPIPSKSSSVAPGPEEIAAKERDDRLQEVVDQYNAKKRPAPLVDSHLEAKKKRDDTSVTGVGRERKPFSREDDLHVNKFDEAQKSTILKKARQLNDRFASGKAAKFL